MREEPASKRGTTCPLYTSDAFILGINDVFALCVCIALGTMLLLAFVKAMKPTPVSPVDLGTPGN